MKYSMPFYSFLLFALTFSQACAQLSTADVEVLKGLARVSALLNTDAGNAALWIDPVI